MTTIILAVLPLLGVVVGAVLQYWLSRNAENRKQLHALRREAYVDFLRAVTKVARAKDPESSWDARTAVADAKARIAVYGDARVVVALARFEQEGAFLVEEGAMSAFVALASAMREHEPATGADLRLILLGPTDEKALPNSPLQRT